MSKKRIAILSNFPGGLYFDEIPKPGYYQVWLEALFHAFCSLDDYEIHWVVANKHIKKSKEYILKGQHFHLIPKARLTMGLYTAYCYDRYQIGKCLKKIQPDLVHAWGTEDCYGLCAKDFKGKRVISMQGMLNACYQRAKMSKFARVQRLYEPSICNSDSYITTESQWAADRVKELAPHADVTLWEYAAEPRFFAIKRNPTPEPTCLMAGTNSHLKNVRLAIQAFSQPELSHVKLYLAGVKPDAYDNLPDNIIPLGFVGRDEVANLLSTTWCLVHPSLADSSPNIVKEARVIGVPAIVTTECGGKQYIDNGKSGFVITPNNLEELVAAVLHVTSSREKSLEMGSHQHELCRQLLSEKTMIDGLKRIYKRVLEST